MRPNRRNCLFPTANPLPVSPMLRCCVCCRAGQLCSGRCAGGSPGSVEGAAAPTVSIGRGPCRHNRRLLQRSCGGRAWFCLLAAQLKRFAWCTAAWEALSRARHLPWLCGCLHACLGIARGSSGTRQLLALPASCCGVCHVAWEMRAWPHVMTLAGMDVHALPVCSPAYCCFNVCLRSPVTRLPRRCLEVGCGSGYVICSLALLLRELGIAAQLLATDINPQAAAATRATLAAHEASEQMSGHMFMWLCLKVCLAAGVSWSMRERCSGVECCAPKLHAVLMPCHAMPCHAAAASSHHSCHAGPCDAMPCHAMPCHDAAATFHAMPCHAMPCRAMPNLSAGWCGSMASHSNLVHSFPVQPFFCNAGGAASGCAAVRPRLRAAAGG